MTKLHREKLFGVFQHIDIYTFVAGYIKEKKKYALCCTPKTQTMLCVK